MISRLSSLGDIVCSLPAALALKKAFPECHITWAVDKRFGGIVECCSAVDEMVQVKPGFKASTWPTYAEPFEAALDLQGLLKSAAAIAKAKASVKVGYHWQREGSSLFSSRVLPDPSSFHIVDQYVDVARAVGGKMDRAEFGLVPKPEDLANVRERLVGAGVDGKFVAMNAGAGWITKRWPPERFAKLTIELANRGIRSALIGATEADREAIAAISASGGQFADMSGKTNVRELVAFLSLASAHVGGDTGSSHLAAALGIPAIGLYSITRPLRSCPYGQFFRCHYNPQGLAEISVEEVLPTVLQALDES